MLLAKEYRPQKIITARSQYGCDITEEDCPREYQFTGEFRPVKSGETALLGGPGHWAAVLIRQDGQDHEPFYILTEKQPDLADEFELAPGKNPRAMKSGDWVWKWDDALKGSMRVVRNPDPRVSDLLPEKLFVLQYGFEGEEAEFLGVFTGRAKARQALKSHLKNVRIAERAHPDITKCLNMREYSQLAHEFHKRFKSIIPYLNLDRDGYRISEVPVNQIVLG